MSLDTSSGPSRVIGDLQLTWVVPTNMPEQLIEQANRLNEQGDALKKEARGLRILASALKYGAARPGYQIPGVGEPRPVQDAG